MVPSPLLQTPHPPHNTDTELDIHSEYSSHTLAPLLSHTNTLSSHSSQWSKCFIFVDHQRWSEAAGGKRKLKHNYTRKRPGVAMLWNYRDWWVGGERRADRLRQKTFICLFHFVVVICFGVCLFFDCLKLLRNEKFSLLLLWQHMKANGVGIYHCPEATWGCARC